MPKSAMKSKAMKAAKAMTKAQLADQLATKSELKKKDCGALRGARSCSAAFWSKLHVVRRSSCRCRALPHVSILT